jgi:GxxExxY protein
LFRSPQAAKLAEWTTDFTDHTDRCCTRRKPSGFLEAVYQECLALEFADRTIPFRAQQALGLEYKGRRLRQTYAPDFVCFDKIIVELKVVREIAPEHRAQVINYLRASGMKVGCW